MRQRRYAVSPYGSRNGDPARQSHIMPQGNSSGNPRHVCYSSTHHPLGARPRQCFLMTLAPRRTVLRRTAQERPPARVPLHVRDDTRPSQSRTHSRMLGQMLCSTRHAIRTNMRPCVQPMPLQLRKKTMRFQSRCHKTCMNIQIILKPRPHNHSTQHGL